MQHYVSHSSAKIMEAPESCVLCKDYIYFVDYYSPVMRRTHNARGELENIAHYVVGLSDGDNDLVLSMINDLRDDLVAIHRLCGQGRERDISHAKFHRAPCTCRVRCCTYLCEGRVSISK